ncbi:hypothetical protein [Cyclobacterium jeungdonense]|uniref:Histidine kinase N-terminal 7TM region domain-containing protein n=1 Tax=Cyclobacterium jeungdonense TaxID=708087 RepID=A0ABT8C269_9BACT|nr:hypothetical protein [Cyclobacterium jeungdonense]MDN3686874.1 hypothetical protein [Cyclobacterium jeungdonense]
MEFGEFVAYLVLSLAMLNAIVLILATKRAKVSQQYMGFAILFFSSFLFFQHLEVASAWLPALTYLLMLCVGPFFYFFIRNTLVGSKRNSYLDLLHFIPFILSAIPIVLLFAGEELSGFVLSFPQPMEGAAPGRSVFLFAGSIELLLCSLLIYFFLGLRLLLYLPPINIHFSEQRKLKRWLIRISWLFGFLLVLFTLSQDYVGWFAEQKDLLINQGMPVVLLVLSVAMHFRPSLIYGFDFGEQSET